jgi:hypothetical protein
MAQRESNALSKDLENKPKRRPQEGNAAWKAARDSIKPGYANRRRCVAIARTRGAQCGRLALSGVIVCEHHGGRMIQLNIKRKEERLNGKRTTQGGIDGRRFKRAAIKCLTT